MHRALGIALVVVIIIALLFLAWSGHRYRQEQWRAGGLYSVRQGAEFGIAKVLVVDSAAVHVRVYQQRSASRPSTVDPSTLTLGKLGDKNFSIGHVPLSRKSFSSWDPVFLNQQSVSEDELDGYRIWQHDNGGVFSPPD